MPNFDVINQVLQKLKPIADENAMNAELEQLYAPGQAEQAYNEYLTRVPSREDNKPSTLRRIAAALAGGAQGFATRNAGAGAELGQSILNKPFEEKLQDFNQEGVRLGKLADIEKEGAQSRRGLFSAKQQAKNQGDLAELKQLELENRGLRFNEEQRGKAEDRTRKDKELERDIARDKEAGRHNSVMESIARENAGKRGDTQALKGAQSVYQKRIKGFDDATRSYNQLQQIPKNGTGVDQLNALYKHIKNLDNSAVKEGELRLFKEAQSFLGQLDVYLSKFGDNPKALDQKTVDDLFRSAEEMYKSSMSEKRQLHRDMKSYADRNGLNFEDISYGQKYEGDEDQKLNEDEAAANAYLSKRRGGGQ